MNRFKVYIYKNYTNRHFLFVVLWILTALLFQYQKVITLHPLSIHQGAQTDRASIAINYYRISMNFLEPRVMETNTLNGITPCEFPVVNYTVALLYKAFGPNPFWYRLLMMCLMAIGLWAAFDMLCLWLGNKWAALLVSFTWFYSGILNFYTPNFVPDTASLAMMLLALRQWYFYNMQPVKVRIVWFTVFAALACLIKITSLIFVIAIVLVSLLRFIQTHYKPKFIGAAGIVIILVGGWYIYCQWLERKVGGSYFLMKAAIPSSVAEFREWFHIFWANWVFQLYNISQWIFIIIGIVAVPFTKEKLFLKQFVLISLAGCICFYVLMAGQFRYHDYYSIALLPVFLFFMAFGFRWLYSLKPWLAYVLILVAGVWGLIDAKNSFRLRYTKGNYSYQTFFEPSDFEGADEWLTKNGISREKKVLAAFDINPNNMLYFLNRQGYRVYDHNYHFVKGKLKDVDGLVTNDSTQFFSKYPLTREQLTYSSAFNKLILYKHK